MRNLVSARCLSNRAARTIEQLMTKRGRRVAWGIEPLAPAERPPDGVPVHAAGVSSAGQRVCDASSKHARIPNGARRVISAPLLALLACLTLLFAAAPALLATATAGAATTHSGGYKACPSGKYVNVYVKSVGYLTVGYWLGSGSPADPGSGIRHYVRYGYTRNIETFTPTNQQFSSWSADVTGSNAQIVKSYAYCDG